MEMEIKSASKRVGESSDLVQIMIHFVRLFIFLIIIIFVVVVGRKEKREQNSVRKIERVSDETEKNHSRTKERS